jgi:RNA polymerase-binding transcription factor DksA
MRPEEALTRLSLRSAALCVSSPAIRTETELFVIAIQPTDRRTPVPPDPLSPPQAPPEQPQDQEERVVGAESLRFQQLLTRLEEGYEFHTMQLAQLNGRPADPGQDFERHSLAVASRRALSLIAGALRDMAEGRYGICASCGQPIPVERLEVRPEARHCLRCQASAGA